MTTLTFDTLGYAKKLEEAGFTRQQAEVQANAMREVIEERLATKADIVLLEERLNHELQKLELRIILKLGAMLTAAIAVVATMVKLL